MDTLDSDIIESYKRINDQKIISLRKFIILSFITFGLYQTWWTYKQWKFFKQREKSDYSPFLKTILSFFFIFSLFKKIEKYSIEKDYKINYSSFILYTLYIVLALVGYFPDPYGYLAFISFIFFIPPFRALNHAKIHSIEFKSEIVESYSTRQKILIIICLLLWISIFYDLIIGFNQ